MSSDLVQRLDAAVSRFVAAGVDHGIVMPPADPAVGQLIDQVNADITPFRLPADIEHFYRTWSPLELGLWLYPAFCDLEFALDSWHLHNEDQPPWPTSVLFPIAYTSHAHLMVELDHERSPGPFIYDCMYAGGRFTLMHSCLAAHFEWAAHELEAGRIDSVAGGHDSLSNPLPSDDTDPDRSTWLDRDGVTAEHIPWFDDGDRREWPRRWNLADGYDLDEYELQGATHTIAEYIAALNSGPVTATLHVAFEVQLGSTVRVFDGDDRMVVTLSPGAKPIGDGPVWEIDVVGGHDPELRPNEPPPPERNIPPWDDAIRLDPARLDAYVKAATAHWDLGGEPAATVTVARPIDVDEVLAQAQLDVDVDG